LDSFLADQLKKVSVKTARLHLTAIISYLGYHDIDIIPARFKKKVTVPKLHKGKEQPIDAKDIRKILLACTGAGNRRLKAYLLVLASGGMREVEALAVRNKDIDFSVSPTKIHIREEFAKTRVARDIYVSDEATQALKVMINWKNETGKPSMKDDLVFQMRRRKSSPESLYRNIALEFSILRDSAGFTEKKDNSRRHKVTLQSIRRFVKTTISHVAGKDYSEWFLGHAGSTYYSAKEEVMREIYATRCMKYLTFLDYTTLEARGKSIEANLQEKDREIAALKEKYDTDIASLKDEMRYMHQLLNSIQTR
jgi:hypothetical protein